MGTCLQKKIFQSLKLVHIRPPPPPKKLIWPVFFPLCEPVNSLALWLQWRSATAMITGSNPAQRIKFCSRYAMGTCLQKKYSDLSNWFIFASPPPPSPQKAYIEGLFSSMGTSQFVSSVVTAEVCHCYVHGFESRPTQAS